jgi:hypothetical protein
VLGAVGIMDKEAAMMREGGHNDDGAPGVLRAHGVVQPRVHA